MTEGVRMFRECKTDGMRCTCIVYVVRKWLVIVLHLLYFLFRFDMTLGEFLVFFHFLLSLKFAFYIIILHSYLFVLLNAAIFLFSLFFNKKNFFYVLYVCGWCFGWISLYNSQHERMRKDGGVLLFHIAITDKTIVTIILMVMVEF